MKDGASTHFVLGRSLLIIHLFSGEDESLLRGRNALFLFHTLFNSLHLVRGLDVDFDLLAGESFDFDQHDDPFLVRAESREGILELKKICRDNKIGGKGRESLTRWGIILAEFNNTWLLSKECGVSSGQGKFKFQIQTSL